MSLGVRSAVVVDDDYCMREHLAELLRRAGFDAFMAPDGQKALAIIRGIEALDLVVTDVFMPEREGIALIRDLHRGYPGVRILAISGGGAFAGPREYLGAAVALGAHASLEKPFSDDVFLAKVAALLSSPPEVAGTAPAGQHATTD
jgi:DNA-binding response OmpR family regulator